MKKYLAALLAIVMVFSLSVPAFAANEKTQITWYSVDVEPKSLIEAFNSTHDDVEVVYELVSTDNYFTTLNTRISAGECPDLFPYRQTDYYEDLIAMDAIVDLTDYEFMNNFTDASKQMNFAKNGRLYAFPLAANYLCLFYNKTLLTELGYPEGPKNYQEYIDICAKVSEMGISPLVSGSKDLWQNRYVCVDPLQGAVAKDDTWLERLYNYEAGFTDEVILDYFDRYEEFVNKGYLYDGSLGLTMAEAWQVFASGKAAFQLGATFYVQQAFPSADCEFELGVCPMPVNDEGEDQVVELHANMTVLAVNKNSDHLDKVLEFLEWFAQAENYMLFCEDSSTIITTHKDTDYSRLNSFASMWDGWATKYRNVARGIEPSSITTEFGQVLQNVILGSYDGRTAAAELQTAYENKR